MPQDEIDALVEDIKRRGQRDPGVLYEGMVLDGWHRYQACKIAGLGFRATPYEGDDPIAFVLSKNLIRRHLTASQRAAAVVAAHNWRPNGVARPAMLQGSATSADMAREADVGERTIVHAKRAQEIGLGPEVKDGKVSASTAAAVANLPTEKRKKAVRAIKEGRAAMLQPKAKKSIEDVTKLNVRISVLETQLTETKEALADMTDLAASARAFEEKTEFKEMQVLRLELKSCKRRRDELMAENADMKKQIAFWKKKADKK